GRSDNGMSRRGLAFGSGLMGDGSAVVVETAFSKLSHAHKTSKARTIHDAVIEVATPVVFGVGIIILVFLPLMTLEGMEGKMFSPLAYTIAIALGISLVLSLTLSPVLSSFLLRGGSEKDTLFVRALKVPFTKVLEWSLSHRGIVAVTVILLFGGALALFPYLGTAFIPEMKEGSVSPNFDRVPNISLDESIKMEMAADRAIRGVAGVTKVVSRL